ncbi:acyl-CoA dehydrogenase family protein [Nonomuraea wenchangensis]|uniref:Acyl-CoA dehydrogenase n=1 Tax=Nonomuraea wenchangensis TaxID=568860 RepID=A0A1I0L758_9ACTN|nr:acyl-CoA dehydrogenase family protein [Nonomuraea wenchangensis]SEU35816.1 Acyl-CoA dehydrogenase [Nonomuraea wenchangensis]
MRRELYTEDHEEYRQTVREFLAREVVPHYRRWEEERGMDRGVLAAARRQGVAGLEVPEEYGGAGVKDYRYRMVVCEEVARVHATTFTVTLGLQDDLVLNYLLDLTTEEQKRRWLPGFAGGDVIGALAMTEPGTGSDLQGMRTSARRDGDSWLLNGQKTFISSGITADLVIVAARTDPEAGSRGYSLFVVEDGMPGFTRGRQLDKLGLHGQDTAELFFEDVRVPQANLLGAEGQGLRYLMSHLARERLGIIAQSMTGARAVYELTRDYCFQREAFGRRIGDFQATRFALAEMETELDIAQAYTDRCVLAHNAGELTPVDAAKGKWWISELQKRVVDQCLQLHGGYGYMLEYPVARAFADTRIQTIYGGTTEIMKEIIGRDLAARS